MPLARAAMKLRVMCAPECKFVLYRTLENCYYYLRELCGEVQRQSPMMIFQPCNKHKIEFLEYS